MPFFHWSCFSLFFDESPVFYFQKQTKILSKIDRLVALEAILGRTYFSGLKWLKNVRACINREREPPDSKWRPVKQRVKQRIKKPTKTDESWVSFFDFYEHLHVCMSCAFSGKRPRISMSRCWHLCTCLGSAYKCTCVRVSDQLTSVPVYVSWIGLQVNYFLWFRDWQIVSLQLYV